MMELETPPAVTILLPKPPSVNRLHGRSKTGQVFTSPAYKAWKLEAAWEYHRQRRRITPIRGPYTLRVILSAHRRRGDCDNFVKATSDLLVKMGAIPDDRLAESATGTWDDTGTVPKGFCRVELRPAERKAA